MEATKKTSVTRAALLVVAALSMLLSGLFVATAQRSDASPPPACPVGFNLTQDGKNCFQNAVVTSTDNPNSCAEGQLTPDGSKCYIAADVIPQEGETFCPKGYSPDTSLGEMCARFEDASQRDPGCPADARGVAGGCYILVAKGPRGDAACADTSFTLQGTLCVKTGQAPIPGLLSCPVNGTTVFGTASDCYRINPPTTTVGACPNDATWVTDAGQCKSFFMSSVPANTPCPTPPAGATAEIKGSIDPDDGHIKYLYCAATFSGTTACTTGTPIGDPVTGCRVPQNLTSGGTVCPQADEGYVKSGSTCVLYSSPGVPDARCPEGSFEVVLDADRASTECRKPVADVAGEYYCKDADAALNAKSCVYTAPFTVEPAPDAYKCSKGARAVIGTNVICFLGDADANTSSGPSCLQGVLSTDNLYCIVPRIDTAPAAVSAPVPSFTG